MEKLGRTIILNENKYGVHDSYPLFDIGFGEATYEIIETTCTREREFFAWFPLYVEGKIRFLQRTLARERLNLYRFRDIDDYPDFKWDKWREKWEIEEII